MKKRKNIAFLSLVLTGGLLLAACGSSSNTSAESTSAAEETEASVQEGTEETEEAAAPAVALAEDQTLNLLMSNVYTLDLNDISWTKESEIIQHTQVGLFRAVVNEDGSESFVNDGAESYEVSDDGMVYTVTLRDLVWSDGEPLTAQHYVDTFVRELTAENGFANIANYNFVKNGNAYYNGEAEAEDLGIVALDDKTLEITFENADVDALRKIAGVAYPIRLDVVEAASGDYGTKADEMVYSGPFVVSEWIASNKLVLKKNPLYWDADSIILDTINYSYVAEPGTQATLFNSQQLDVVEYNDDYADTWEQQAAAGEITYLVQPASLVRWVVFNQGGKSPLMENSKIRLAISLAIDRQGYVDTIYNRYYPAWDYTPPTITVQGLPYNSYESGTITELLEQYPDDESKRELLKEGLAEIGYEYDDLSDVVINYTDKSYNSTDQARIEYLRQNLENVLGITVETVQTTLESSYMVDGDYDITTSTWTSTSPYSSLRNFEKNGKALLAGFYENDEVQALYDSTVGVTDPAEIVRIYKEIETRLVSEAVVAPIYWGDTRYFIQNYVQGADIRTVSSTNDFSRAYILEH